jgi:hypothetical protein
VAHGGKAEQIELISMDMSSAYQSGASRFFPQAEAHDLLLMVEGQWERGFSPLALSWRLLTSKSARNTESISENILTPSESASLSNEMNKMHDVTEPLPDPHTGKPSFVRRWPLSLLIAGPL